MHNFQNKQYCKENDTAQKVQLKYDNSFDGAILLPEFFLKLLRYRSAYLLITKPTINNKMPMMNRGSL